MSSRSPQSPVSAPARLTACRLPEGDPDGSEPPRSPPRTPPGVRGIRQLDLPRGSTQHVRPDDAAGVLDAVAAGVLVGRVAVGFAVRGTVAPGYAAHRPGARRGGRKWLTPRPRCSAT